MAIRKLVLQVSVLYDDAISDPMGWSLGTVAREIDEGDCFGWIEEVSDEPLTDEQVRDAECGHGGDGTFMLGGS